MKFLVAILILVHFFIDSEACNCGDNLTPQRQFCDAHWVAHAKILDTKPSSVPDLLQYNVEYIETFKISPQKKSLPTEISTPKGAPKCDLILENGKEYLLAGSYENGEMKIFRCAQFKSTNEEMEWQKIPETIKSGLKSFKC